MTTTANTILEQLGGSKFIAMTGSKDFVGGVNSLSFRLPKNKSGANICRVTLSPADLYHVAFISLRGVKCRTVAVCDGVYADRLQDLFTQHTGLYTSLGTLGR